jgi:hypothetical protein
VSLLSVLVLWPPFSAGAAEPSEPPPTYLVSIARPLAEPAGSIARALPPEPTLGSIPRVLDDEPSALGATSYD